jgi:hypothetical protein
LKKSIALVVLVLLSLAVVVSGCGGSEKPTPPAIKAAQIPEQAKQNALPKAVPATTTTPGASEPWPSDIPREVPQYAGGLLKRISAPDKEKRKVSVLISNTTVADYTKYVQTLSGAGFNKVIEMDDPGNSMFSGKKGQTEVTVMLDKKKNSVTLMTIIHK